jgi:uncharacterized protein YbjT (DUF2867 family)
MQLMGNMRLVLGLMALVVMMTASSCAVGDAKLASESELIENELILVVGASGRTGRYVIKYLKEDGRNFIAMTSNKARAMEKVEGDYNWVEADVKDPKTLEPIMVGVTKIISGLGASKFTGPNAPEFIDYGGLKNIVDVAVAAGTVDQIVQMSSSGLTQKDNPLNKYGKVLTWKLKGEDYLRASSISHTIIRAGGLADTEADSVGIRMQQGDTIPMNGGFTGRGNFAALCIEAIDNDAAKNKTFEAVDDDTREIGTWRQEFGLLVADEKN